MTAPSSTDATPPPRGTWFIVPRGTREATCRSCGARIFWIQTAGGRNMPVDCSVEGGRAPAPLPMRLAAGEDGHGVGLSHFATCAQADQWRTRR